MSLSEQRILLLLSAFIKFPPLLILDEPFQNLDDKYISIFKIYINNMMLNINKTLIIVTHSVEEIPSCVNQYLYLRNGTIEKQINN
ncbi:MAG: hypothetical protein H6553_02325 [Chitinophagales bacterium]|nr:hypothetical protein [Chitinophagales bacterium]